MELLERENYLNELTNHFGGAAEGSGHAVFLTGEAGVGKTSLVNHFLKKMEHQALIYSGACDSLFTPRPLGPLFDIAHQVGPDFQDVLRYEKDRSLIFSTLLQKLSAAEKPVILLFEDIHWADEATVDLIKFFGRRIARYRCLFLLTYRDDEVHPRHPVASIFGELPAMNFSKLGIKRFSKEAVNQLAIAKGYPSGDHIYHLTDGNPFYVTEILASYSPGIPERIKDSILAVFHGRQDNTRYLWEFLSILPSSRIEFSMAKRIEREFTSLEDCILSGVVVSKPGHLSFKHELFRLAIEESLTPSRRRSLHKKMLDIMQEGPVESTDLTQLVHHAMFAEERQLVALTAPQAAQQAAGVGSHIEAARLYSVAIEYTEKNNPIVVELYERHAYECYLTNQITSAIYSQQHALILWQERKVSLKEGDTLRFLSRLWWYAGSHEKAEMYGLQAIEVLENGFPTRERALAYSNYAQLFMLCDNSGEALKWGNKAIDLATRMEDHEILSHALNNVGSILMKFQATEKAGEDKLRQSLSIALEYGYQEHVARAYTNLISVNIFVRKYSKASAWFDVALKYCDDRDLKSWFYYILSCKVQFLTGIGKWEEGEALARNVLSNPNQPGIVKIVTLSSLSRILMRQGKHKEAAAIILEGKAMAGPTEEAHRIIPLLVAQLEHYWLGGGTIVVDEITDALGTLFQEKNYYWHYSELIYWMEKCGIAENDSKDMLLTTPFELARNKDWKGAAEYWHEAGSRYEEALSLFEGDEENQKRALAILDELNAPAALELLKSKLKLQGMRNIPRGPRESTRTNPAQLTNRQIDVLELLKEGLQNSEIADKLFISAKTVDHHISSILSKLSVNSRTKAVSEARKLGILN